MFRFFPAHGKIDVSMKIISILILILAPIQILCSKEIFFIKDLSLGIHYASLKENRGVVSYDDFQIDPVITFEFLNPDFEFEGDSISYKKFIKPDNILYRTRIVYINDLPFFPNKHNIGNSFHHRQTSYEWSHRFEYYFNSYNEKYWAEIDLEYDKDTITHHGNYFTLESKLKLFTYKVFEPNLFLGLGLGDKKNNNYYYGPDSTNFGLSDFRAGINLLIPKYVDRFYSVADIHYFSVLNDQNKNAVYAKTKHNGIICTISLTQDLN